jgi:hypothetical protein
MKITSFLLPLLSLLLISGSFCQDEHSSRNKGEDLRHSVFGPPRPAMWEFQFSYMTEGIENVSSFNFYKKDQRNKTLFFKIANNGLNNRNEFRVQELTGGAVLFPINDDDRYQLDIGGTYEKSQDTVLNGKAFYSRATLRSIPHLWLRVGVEYFDGFTAGNRTPYRNTIVNSNYFVGKVTVDRFSLVGIIGTGKIDDALNTRFGGAGIIDGPFNTFLLGGYIKSNESKENVWTGAIGRSAPFRPDGLPSTIFIWKHRDNYDFQLGGLFWGGNNLFVHTAAIGMSQGIFISSAALRENSELRRGQLMSITDDYRNSDVTVFYVYLNQGIEIMPGDINHIGFRAIQLYKIFSKVKVSVFSKPVIGLFYNEETEPVFNTLSHRFTDRQKTYFSYQAGMTFYDDFILNVIHTPEKSDWIVAFSYLYF